MTSKLVTGDRYGYFLPGHYLTPTETFYTELMVNLKITIIVLKPKKNDKINQRVRILLRLVKVE